MDADSFLAVVRATEISRMQSDSKLTCAGIKTKSSFDLHLLLFCYSIDNVMQ